MRVSICTSVLNQSEYLRKMIASVLAQTFTDWELIIVDDGSTEDIKSLVESYQDPRLVYERFQENKGIPHGLNHAFTLASGDYLQPLSADEWIWERKLEVQVAWMDEHPGIGCTWGLPWKGEMGERPTWEQYQWKAHNRSREAWIRTLLRLENIPIGGASMLMRKECYQEIGGFDPQFFDVSDLEWFVRFFQKYQGWILPYRMADADQPENRLTGPTPERGARFQENMRLLHAKHSIVLPPASGRVSVHIPVRNMDKFVAHTLDSLKQQTFQDFDVVVFDDASEDDTLEVVRTWVALEEWSDRVELIHSKDNVGVAAAQNHMLALTDAPFVVPFSADDVLAPTFLERCLAEFSRDPFLEMVATQTDFIDKEGKTVTDHQFLSILKAHNKPRTDWLNQLYYGNNYFGAGMYRTQALKDVGGYDPTVGVICDYDVYLKLLQRENIHIIEENLTHTRCHDGQQSIGKDRQWNIDLRNNYHTIKTRYYQPRMKVVIATPFYEMRGFSPYICSLAATIQFLTRLGIEHEYYELSGDSYVDRAKNTLLNKFLEDPAATDLFMIDSDMQWNHLAFIEMLQLPEQIVMGSYPQKNSWETWTARPVLQELDGKQHPIGRQLPNGSALLKSAYLAGGFMRLKRACLEKYKEHYKEFVYYDPGADPGFSDRLYTEFFTCERAKNEDGVSLRWGEDRVFGRRMEAIGIESWIYPKIDFGHYGIKGWMGNYDTYLRQPQKAA